MRPAKPKPTKANVPNNVNLKIIKSPITVPNSTKPKHRNTPKQQIIKPFEMIIKHQEASTEMAGQP